jgi:dCTP deaminase
MILSDSAVITAMAVGEIEIQPYDRERLGSNSYDMTLGDTLLAFPYGDFVVDVKKPPQMYEIVIPEEGYELQPNRLYLGVTREWARSGPYLAEIDGKSSVGRLGIGVHVTAGGCP